ncbi:MAG TPA: hypothetical protein VK694_02840 [Verrucomicrobiae bacterium]|nr:hypothetical protein [Verrucomicrobiae bacterium]
MTISTQPRRRLRPIVLGALLICLVAVTGACVTTGPSEEATAKEEARQVAQEAAQSKLEARGFTVVEIYSFGYDDETDFSRGTFVTRIDDCGVDLDFEITGGEQLDIFVWREPLELEDGQFFGYERERRFFDSEDEYRDLRGLACSSPTTADAIDIVIPSSP